MSPLDPKRRSDFPRSGRFKTNRADIAGPLQDPSKDTRWKPPFDFGTRDFHSGRASGESDVRPARYGLGFRHEGSYWLATECTGHFKVANRSRRLPHAYHPPSRTRSL